MSLVDYESNEDERSGSQYGSDNDCDDPELEITEVVKKETKKKLKDEKGKRKEAQGKKNNSTYFEY